MLPFPINIKLNLEIVIYIYQLLLGLIILIQTLYFFRGGYYFKNETNYFFNSPFVFIRVLPKLLHNIFLLALPINGLMIMSMYPPFVISGCFISAVILFYMSVFCYSVWHHSIFLFVNILFLSGLFFTFPLSIFSNPFLTLIVLQISIVYIFAGIAKLNFQLIRSNLLVDALLDRYKNFLLKNYFLIKPFNLSVIFGELALGFAFWFPKFGIQKAAIVLGIIFHIAIIVMTGRGGTFHILLPATYLLIIIKNFSFYEDQIIFFLALIFLPILFLFLFYTHYNRRVKDYMQDQE